MLNPEYVDLQVTSNLSFLRGASSPEELAQSALSKGHSAFSLTDHNTVSGIVRGHTISKKLGIQFIIGCHLDLLSVPRWKDNQHTWQSSLTSNSVHAPMLDNGIIIESSILVYPTNSVAYSNMCNLLTLGKQRAPKQKCFLTIDDIEAYSTDLIAIALVPQALFLVEGVKSSFYKTLYKLKDIFPKRLYIGSCLRGLPSASRELWNMKGISKLFNIPVIAINDIRMHSPLRRPLLDVITCIRERSVLQDADYILQKNSELYHKHPVEMLQLFRELPDAIMRTVEVAEACKFSLDELNYEYPVISLSGNYSPKKELRKLTLQGATQRYPDGIPLKIKNQISYELNIISRLNYEPYFLTVVDIIQYAIQRGILYQGRGSAANSVVCYCLGITIIDPDKTDILFERFISESRNEPPDIDIDFEHERREEVIQYIYEKYTRANVALTATVITYKQRSAFRDVGKVLGLSQEVISILSRGEWQLKKPKESISVLDKYGINTMDERVNMALELVEQLKNFPRHLSQHVGGFVFSKSPLHNIVPITNASMKNRTVIEWDKNDIDALGILKVDILALGMLSCIRKSFDMIKQYYNVDLNLANIPQDDTLTYKMLQKADTVGVFQVESRAQMSMLPRLKPKNFYDLVVQIAIVRPGPIHGNMVYPYLRRRLGVEKIKYYSEPLRKILERTLGIPIFQEQAMKIAIVGAGFTPDEADLLRRSMVVWKRDGNVDKLKNRFIKGMSVNGYANWFAKKCFEQIEGFGKYGFPESHAYSFALITYISAWLKCNYPEVFTCALLNSQPMGFYNPSQIVQDAERHGIVVLPVCINRSQWECVLERSSDSYSIRLGFSYVKGIKETDINDIITHRGRWYNDPYDVWVSIVEPSSTLQNTLEKLAQADSFAMSLNNKNSLNRRQALWNVKGIINKPIPLLDGLGLPSSHLKSIKEIEGEAFEPLVSLPVASVKEEILSDYNTIGMSFRGHPLSVMRKNLHKYNVITASQLKGKKNNTTVNVAGLVICRQQPSSANGVVFLTLEDETGLLNLVIWPKVFIRFKAVIIGSRLLYVEGALQSRQNVMNVMVKTLKDFSGFLSP